MAKGLKAMPMRQLTLSKPLQAFLVIASVPDCMGALQGQCPASGVGAMGRPRPRHGVPESSSPKPELL